MVPENDLALSGLISYGGCSDNFFYQMWLTNHHPDMCSVHPTEMWLEQASCLLVHDYNSKTAAINSSDYVLKNFSLQAIADYLIDERDKHLGFDSKILIPPVLNDILNRHAKEELLINRFEYAYAVTCHKMQGSECRAALIFDESFIMKAEEDKLRWLYTSVTRAQERLVILR